MNRACQLTIATIAAMLIFSSSTISQVSEKNNSARLVSANNNCEALRTFFIDTLLLANKPGGLTITKKTCRENAPFPDFKSQDISFVERLDLLTVTNPNYSWKDEEGVITLAPKNSGPELLSVKIRELKITFDTNLAPVISQILGSPEVKEKTRELGMRTGLQFGGLQSPPSKKVPIEMQFTDRTLRQILNEIVRKRGRGVWVYRESSDNGVKAFSLDFLVQ